MGILGKEGERGRGGGERGEGGREGGRGEREERRKVLDCLEDSRIVQGGLNKTIKGSALSYSPSSIIGWGGPKYLASASSSL